MKKLCAPKYAIGQIVYIRASAGRGFVEHLYIKEMVFDNKSNQYCYSFKDSPFRTLENDLTDLKDALRLQLCKLENDLAKALNQQSKVQTLEPMKEEKIIYRTTVSPGAPTYNINDLVYLIESANTNGMLEVYRIDGVSWDNEVEDWIYSFNISPRPEHNTAMSMRNTRRKSFTLKYPEGQLCTFYTAITAVIAFLNSAITLNKNRQDVLNNISGLTS